MEFSERKQKILRTIIDDYISTAVPVGSRSIAEHFGMKISSATIRSEMNELESMGYLAQLHTSSGRIPSEKAYRFYVDSLMQMAALSSSEMDYICKYFDKRMLETEAVLTAAAKAIAEATDYVALVTAPHLKSILIRYIQLVPISARSALAVIITDQGIIKDMPIALEAPMTPDQLVDISKILNRIFSGRVLTEEDLNTNVAIIEEIQGQRLLFTQLTNIIKAHMSNGEKKHIAIGGVPKLLNYPEYSDIQKAKNLLEIFDSKEMLSRIVDNESNVEVRIRIGNENGIDELNDCSVVTATYRVNDETVGTIGVIGPVRMQYSKVISVLDYVSSSLPEVLTSINDNDDMNGGKK